MNENNYCIGEFFDLKKAFDVCSHDILLMKLNKMGVNGVALEWFRSYLSDRQQCVDINGNLSDAGKLKSPYFKAVYSAPSCFCAS